MDLNLKKSKAYQIKMNLVGGLILSFLFLSNTLSAQFETNRLKNKHWYTLALGPSSADELSSSVSLGYTGRNDMLVSAYRFQYQGQLFEPTDSCSFKARSFEFAALWGEGTAGKNSYVVFMAGMGLTRRIYCLGEDQQYQRKARTLVGVPFQIEGGLFVNKNWSLGLTIIGGWNFLEPYLGGQLKLSYHLAARQNEEEEE
jgi:hypothetical protein